MANKKLVSVRIDEDLIKFMDERVIGRYALSRSGAIDAALRMVFQQLSDDDLMLAFTNQHGRAGSAVVTLRAVQYMGGGHYMVADPERGRIEY